MISSGVRPTVIDANRHDPGIAAIALRRSCSSFVVAKTVPRIDSHIEQLRGMPNTTGTSPRTLNHVPALDGIRGLGVIAVMLFHHAFFGPVGHISWVGGFLGVDIFFTLSGFLITTLLLIEAENSGRISLPDFWGRRARRLLPALLVTLVAVSIFARQVSSAADLASLRSDSLLTLLYVNNWHSSSAISAVSHT